MTAYTYAKKGLTGANMRKDLDSFTLHIETEEGTITLHMNRAGLDHFVSSLQRIEQQATILNPTAGSAPGERVEMRTEIVNGFQVGHGTVREVRAGKVFFIDVTGSDARAVEADARRMAEELLANTVIEGYDVKVLG